MKKYTFTLGNTTARKGHRRDCAEVGLEVTVWADDPKAAQRRLRDMNGVMLTAADGTPVRLTLGEHVGYTTTPVPALERAS